MKDFSLYVVLDAKWLGDRKASEVAAALAKGGAEIIQYRNKIDSPEKVEKEARQIREALRDTQTFYIVNDDPALARRVAADGVHVGSGDPSVREARCVMGGGIVGFSARSVEEALAAEKEGADYIAVGDLFGTNTKRNAVRTSLLTLAEICRRLSIPVVGIGGVTIENCGDVLAAGASAVAVSGAILEHRDIEKETRTFKRKLESLKERRNS